MMNPKYVPLAALALLASTSAAAEIVTFEFTHPNAFGSFSVDTDLAKARGRERRRIDINGSNYFVEDFSDYAPNTDQLVDLEIIDYELVVAFPDYSFLKSYTNSASDGEFRNAYIQQDSGVWGSQLYFSVFNSTTSQQEIYLSFSTEGTKFTQPTFEDLLNAVDGIYPAPLDLMDGDAFAALGELDFRLSLNNIELINDQGVVQLSSGAIPTPVPGAAFLLAVPALALGARRKGGSRNHLSS